MKIPAGTATITVSVVCPRCGTIEKSGKISCCGRGGSWFKNCGGAGNAKLHHSWYEGIQACKVRLRSNTVIGQQLNAARQKDLDSSQGDGMENSKTVIMASKAFTFTSVNTSTPTSDITSLVTSSYTSGNLTTSTPVLLKITVHLILLLIIVFW